MNRPVPARPASASDWPAAPREHGLPADSDVEGGMGQEAGRVQCWQRGHVRRHQQRDLRAHESDRVTAPGRQPLDDADVLLVRAVLEDAVDQLIEDDLVDDATVLSTGDLGRYAVGGDGSPLRRRPCRSSIPLSHSLATRT